MAISYTIDSLKTEVAATFITLTQQDWLNLIDLHGTFRKFDSQLEWLEGHYPEKVNEHYSHLWDAPFVEKEESETNEEWIVRLQTAQAQYLTKQIARIDLIKKKFACVVMERYLREENIVIRTPIGTTYHVDYANGTDGTGTVHDGILEDNSGSNYTAIASTDTTHIYIAQGAFDNDNDDDYNGDYLYNVTRDIGVIITDYDADDLGGNSVLTHPTITGQTSGDEFYIIRALKTLDRAIETNTLAPGDFVKLRANTTWYQGAGGENSAIVLSDDGSIAAGVITIKGCDSEDDPWNDGSDVRPIIDFEDSLNYLHYNLANHNRVEHIDIIQSASSSFGTVYMYQSVGSSIYDCRILDRGANGPGIYFRFAAECVADSCTIQDTGAADIQVANGNVVTIKNCILNGGSTRPSAVGVNNRESLVYIEDTSISQTTAHTTDEIQSMNGGRTYVRNTALGSSGLGLDAYSYIYFEDYDGTFESNRTYSSRGDIWRETTVVRSGGSDSSVYMVGWTNYCSDIWPHKLSCGRPNGAFKVWCVANITVTVGVWIRTYDVWGTPPTADELYIQASYLSNAGTCARSLSTPSVQTIDNSGSNNWTRFTTTFTPARTGFAYVDVILTNPGTPVDGIYVDLKID